MKPEFPPVAEREVPSQMPASGRCKLAFVGEAPGDEECEKFRPFVGPSGRVFDALLRAASIDRSEVYVGNVFSTKLSENKVSKERAIRGAGWEPFVARNSERLAGELATVRPNVVVPLGGTALLALLGTPSIAKWRGGLCYGVGPYSQQKLLPTWHPAAVLRQWNQFPICIGDYIKAASEAEKGPRIDYPNRVLNIAPTIQEVEDALGRYSSMSGLLSCDIETGWGQIRGVSFAPNEEEAIYVPFISLATINRSYWATPALERRAWEAVKRCLESPTPKLGQNFVNYDVVWLLSKMGIKPARVSEDLRLLHKAVVPELPASLAFMASAYSKQGAWKAWVSHGGAKKAEREEKRDE